MFRSALGKASCEICVVVVAVLDDADPLVLRLTRSLQGAIRKAMDDLSGSKSGAKNQSSFILDLSLKVVSWNHRPSVLSEMSSVSDEGIKIIHETQKKEKKKKKRIHLLHSLQNNDEVDMKMKTITTMEE
ncbi:hypothetical protein BDV26DRAFT_236410 [Aspergillus bertholletiae]|uniref:Uncharacterized protein n=1 Tax=Aspergillus bertholletiae TaxID=1226010 RepID=A0A5N7BL95_9EURO|nr:hypothetical protein BDV26DRAFT_236410 [Aspergillus bertholletiae]